MILEVQVPEEFIDLVLADPKGIGRFNYLSGDIRFERGCGLEELKREWNSLTKQVIVL